MSAGFPEGIKMRGQLRARCDLIFLEKPFEMDTLLTLIQQIPLRELTQAFLFPLQFTTFQ
jgi:hypothetical protein